MNDRARIVRCRDGRHALQMRVEMGVLQMEMEGRPDGERPDGAETYLDYLLRESLMAGEEFVLSEEQCFEVDREFLQFYHRRVCLLALREFSRAIRDADHTLALMDFAAAHSPEEEWTLSHEQYRPFVLFHRSQAAALEALKENGAESAIEECNRGLERKSRSRMTNWSVSSYTSKRRCERNTPWAARWTNSSPTRWPRRSTSGRPGSAIKLPAARATRNPAQPSSSSTASPFPSLVR